MMEMEEQEEQFAKELQQVSEAPSRPKSREKQDSPSVSTNFDNNNNTSFNNMDFGQMMQTMQNSGMGFPPMMGMSYVQAASVHRC